jgi:hypothetical protein
LLILDLDCSDPKQFHVTHKNVKTIGDLLNTSICPDNVTLVKNSYINETDIQQIGLCPFELVFNYDVGRKPAVIVEAKIIDENSTAAHIDIFADITITDV